MVGGQKIPGAGSPDELLTGPAAAATGPGTNNTVAGFFMFSAQNNVAVGRGRAEGGGRRRSYVWVPPRDYRSSVTAFISPLPFFRLLGIPVRRFLPWRPPHPTGVLGETSVHSFFFFHVRLRAKLLGPVGLDVRATFTGKDELRFSTAATCCCAITLLAKRNSIFAKRGALGLFDLLAR